MITATPGITQRVDPANWRQHRFGLPLDRWDGLNGRLVWITGAGTGFGQAMAIALAAAGARVVITGRRLEKLNDTCALATTFDIPQSRIIPLVADVTAPEEVERAAHTVIDRFGAPYGLVNNAALSQRPAGRWPLEMMSVEQWNAQITTNLTGPWLVARAIASAMAAAGVMRILFITSEAGWASTPGVGAYNVSKAALNSLSASLACELSAHYPDADVQVNALIPGEARTEMNRGSEESPFTIASMALTLLSHPPGGPNGRFFHRDGRHFSFAYAPAHDHSLF